jgi:hypothetical protein
MNHYRKNDGSVWGFEDDQADLITDEFTLMTDAEFEAFRNPPLSPAEQVSAATEKIQSTMDIKVQERTYDTILSCAGYASDTPFTAAPDATPEEIAIVALQEKSRIEGNYAKDYMSRTWATANVYLGLVEAGQKPMPTPDEAVAMMPEFTWPD